MLNCSDYSSVTRNLFAAIELRGNDYSSVTRKALRGEEIGQIGCFLRRAACVRAVRAMLGHQCRRTWTARARLGLCKVGIATGDVARRGS